MQVRRSIGCDQPFYPKRANQCYHDAKCAKARWRDKDRPRVRRADPHPPAVQEFFRVVERAMPVNAVGYRLYCRELNVVIPIPGSRRRDGSRPASANFTLRPIEIPILPLDPRCTNRTLAVFFGCASERWAVKARASSRAGDRCPWFDSFWTPVQLRQAWKPPCVFAVVKTFCALNRGMPIACADSPTVGSDMLTGNSLCPINFHFLSSFTL